MQASPIRSVTSRSEDAAPGSVIGPAPGPKPQWTLVVDRPAEPGSPLRAGAAAPPAGQVLHTSAGVDRTRQTSCGRTTSNIRIPPSTGDRQNPLRCRRVHTRENPGGLVDRSFTADKLAAELDRIVTRRGPAPRVLRMDNLPEMVTPTGTSYRVGRDDPLIADRECVRLARRCDSDLEIRQACPAIHEHRKILRRFRPRSGCRGRK
jgi:hypothetical protein